MLIRGKPQDWVGQEYALFGNRDVVVRVTAFESDAGGKPEVVYEFIQFPAAPGSVGRVERVSPRRFRELFRPKEAPAPVESPTYPPLRLVPRTRKDMH